MEALVVDRYGPPDVVRTRTLPDPAPGPREVVVRVHATSINSGDARIRGAHFPPGFNGLLGKLLFGFGGPRKPVLGAELAGVVEEVGRDVRELAVGDRVVAMTGPRMGAHAERCAISVDHCTVPLPDGVAFDDAICLPFGGCTAMRFLDRAKVGAGDRVLVIGASGAVGGAAVQIARIRGARVAAVCSGANAATVRAIGAERVIDYTEVDPYASGETWDVVIDTVGAASVAQVRRLATPTGRVVLVAAGLPQMLAAAWGSLTSRQQVLAGPSTESPEHLRQLVAWLHEGAWRPVVDQRLPLQAGAEGHARVDTGHKVGTVVVHAARSSGEA